MHDRAELSVAAAARAAASVVGNANDISAQAPTGFISRRSALSNNVTNVTSESGPIGNTGPSIANAYTLQINTNFFTSTACAASPNPSCRGWEQFVYENTAAFGSRLHPVLAIRYNATCPAGQAGTSSPLLARRTSTAGRTTPAGRSACPTSRSLTWANWSLSGTVSATGDSVTMSTVPRTIYASTGDNAVNAAAVGRPPNSTSSATAATARAAARASFNSRSVGRRPDRGSSTAAPPRRQLCGARLHRRDEQPQLRTDRSRGARRPGRRSSSGEHCRRRDVELRRRSPPSATRTWRRSTACSTTSRRRAISSWRKSIRSSRFRRGKCRGRRPGRMRR